MNIEKDKKEQPDDNIILKIRYKLTSTKIDGTEQTLSRYINRADCLSSKQLNDIFTDDSKRWYSNCKYLIPLEIEGILSTIFRNDNIIESLKHTCSVLEDHIDVEFTASVTYVDGRLHSFANK